MPKKAEPDKIKALFALMRSYAAVENTTASAKRCVKAMRVLGFTDAEIIKVMHALDYCNQNSDAYSDRIKRVWP